MRSILSGFSIVLCVIASTAVAQDSIKAESLNQRPPDAVAPEIRASLNLEGVRLVDSQGQAFAEIWLRKQIPARSKPEGPRERIQFPFLADGELIGVLQFSGEGQDYREQLIAKGVYTMRYALQPQNGDHLGVSTYRDYMLLLPSTRDKAVTAPARKTLEETSAESAGASHPAAFLLLTPPADTVKGGSSVVHDDDKNTWGVVLPLNLQVKGKREGAGLSVLLIVIGAAAI